MSPLALYLVTVLASISPQLKQERRESIANDVATVVLAEKRAFDEGDETGQQTALLLLALAYHETGGSWATWVDNGSCNDPTWRAQHADLMNRSGDCDGGKAWSMWQIHVPGDSVIAGRALIADRKRAIRTALGLARTSLQAKVGLCGYSGERYPSCTKAALRLSTAQRWIGRFPFIP
jgi:hypothetical protein